MPRNKAYLGRDHFRLTKATFIASAELTTLEKTRPIEQDLNFKHDNKLHRSVAALRS